MTPLEQHRAWRAEEAASLEPLQAELEAARVELAAAERKVAQMKATHQELKVGTLAGLSLSSEGLAGGVWRRLEDARQEMLAEISRTRGKLPALVRSLEERVKSCRMAIVQLDRAIEAAAEASNVTTIRPARRRSVA